MLFCLISLVGTASAEDISDNEIISYDDTIDISTENSNLQEISDLNSASDSNDISNEISNADDTADDTSTDVITGSSSKNVIGANKLTASHDLSGSTVQDIKTLFDSGNIQPGDIIYLGNQDITSSWSEWTGDHIINVNVEGITISGGSADNPSGISTISANQARLFNIQSSGVTLTNIKFLNSHGGNGPGSAISIDASDCTISNCEFENCEYTNGGAIHGSTSSTNTVIENCNFTNNYGRWGGHGGAVYLESTGTISNSNFNGNHAENGNGAVYIADTATVTNCNFTDNYCSGEGGALTLGGDNSVVQNCNFNNNVANGYSQGGALELLGNSPQVINSTFKDNSATSGGAVYIDKPGATLTDCVFEDNKGSFGGAVNIYHDDATLTNCNFTDNEASNQGGAIYIADDCHNAQMTNCNFADNSAPTGTAIYCDDTGDGKVTDCNFGVTPDLSVDSGYPSITLTLGSDYSNIVVGNIDGASGGSIVPLAGEDITLEIFNSNGQLVDTVSGVTDANGQMVYDYGHLPRGNYTYKAHYLDGKTKEGPITMAEVEGSNFSSIQAAIDAAEPGGVIFLKDITYYNDIQDNMVIDKPISIIGTEGTVLDAEGLSRIFKVNDNVKNVNLENITFINGHADEGGAIYGGYGTDDLSVTNCDFINNTADIAGGAVKHHSKWTFTDSAFINNSANPNNNPLYTSDAIPNGGGALWCCDGISTLVGTSFINNNATFGGAIRGAVNARDCVVENNTAFNGNGGGIDLTIDSVLFDDEDFMTSVQIRDSNFTGNSAQGEYMPTEDAKGGKAQGGAIHIYRVEGMVLDNITCTDNSAYRGGALDLYVMNYTTITNSNISDNTATLGGGIAVVGDNCNFTNLTVTNNYAEYGEYHEGEGGGIWVNGSNTLFENSTLDQNVADAYGGGIMSRGSNCSFVNNNLTSNEAFFGGGIAVESHDETGFAENITFFNNTLLYNNAYAGGGVLVQGDQVNFTDNVISNNTATTTGGAFYVVGDELYIENLTSDYNTALNGGSCAIYSCDGLIVKNSTFTGNQALVVEPRGLGGAMHLFSVTSADIQANFYNNTAKNGSAIYSEKSTGVYIHDSDFVENQAYSYILSIAPENNTVLNENQSFDIVVTHIGGDNIMNAIYNTGGSDDIGFTNVTYPFLTVDGQEIIRNTNDGYDPTEVIRPVIGVENSDNGNLLYQDDLENNQIINVLVKDKNNNTAEDINGNPLVFNGLKSDIYGTITIPVAGLKPGRYYVAAAHPEDNYYKIINNITVLRVGPTDLEINKTVSNATCDVEDIVDWNVTTGNIGLIDAENVTIRDTLPEGLDLLNLTFNFFDSINGNWCTGQLDLITNTLTYGVYNATAGTWTSDVASYDGAGTWTIVIPDIDGNDDILKPVTIRLTLNKASSTSVSLFVSDLLENSSVVMNLVTNVTQEGEFTNLANVTTDTPEINYTNNNASNTTKTVEDLTNLTVIKVWDDNNNQDGVRPVNVTIELFADGVKINETVLSADNDWKFTFTDLPVSSNGQVINYTVNETPITNYTAVISNETAYNWTVTNNHTPLVTVVNVTKVWDDKDNQDGVRPPSVVVELYADGVKIDEVVLSADNNWKWTFPDLAVYKNNGTLIVYTVNETPVANYTAVITNETAYDWTVTNNHTPLVTELNVTKVWDDKDNQDGVRPPSVVVELFADGVKINETTLSAENDWKFTFPNLPVKKEGKLIVYTVNETAVANYTTVITNETAYDWTVTNNHTPLVTEVNVTKVWTDNNNQDGVRPPSVVVELYADGVKINETVLSADNDWKFTFPDLAVYKNNGTLIVYTVNETAVANYTVNITVNDDGTFVINNTHVPELTELNVTKVWDDNNNQDGVRPVYVTVELYANGVKINETTLSADNDWKFTFPNLPVYEDGVVIVYTVNETAVANYTTVINNETAYDWTVTNNHTPLVTEVNVTKVWDDNNNQDGVRPVNVTVYLFADGVKINETVLSEDNDWKFTFPNLPVNKDGQVINYTIDEVVVANYTTVITNGTAYDWTVTNNHTPEVTELNVTKVWDDKDNQDGIRPVYVTISLFANGHLINTTNVTAENGWKLTFPNLPVYEDGKLIEYAIIEVWTVEGYDTVISNETAYDWTVTNNHTPIVTELNVTKVWDDKDNQDGVRPVNVTIELFADGVKINETVLSADNDWKFTFPDLAVYRNNGTLIVYTVNETPVANYSTVINNETAYDWIVTNNHTPIVTELNVTKIWDDNDDQDKIRPESVTVYLYADGEKINETVLSADNDWKFTFPDLAVYKNNGTLIIYTIGEAEVANYTAIITNASAYDWTVTNNHSHIYVPNMTVQKIANDVIVYVGNETSFTIVVENTGECNLSDVTVTETWFSEGLEFNGVWTNGNREWTYNGAKVWTLIGILENGTSASFNVFFNVTQNGTLYNNVSAISNLTNETNGTNKTQAYLPNLTVQKITIDEVVYVGNTTSFRIVVTNTGDCNLSDVVVTDVDYSVGLEFADKYDNSSREWTYDGNGHWTLVGDLEVGESAEFTVYFKVLANGTLINNVTATSNLTNETNSSNNTTAYLPNMTVQKITVDEIVYVGNTTSFIVVVTNTGDCNLSDVVVTDLDYSAGLVYADKYENSTRSWNYDGNGHWTLVGDLIVGDSAEFTVYFNVTATGLLVNNVTATSNLTNETNGTNNTTAYGPDMTVQKITIDEIVYVGNITSFKIVVTNTGDCSLSEVVVTDLDYSEGLEFADKYDNSTRLWNYDGNGHWTLVGDLEVGESAEFTVYFKVLANGTLVNNVTATSNLTNETNSSNNTTAYLPNMTVQKITIEEVVYVGNTTSFRIVVTNTGDCNLSDVVVTDIDYSEGLEFADKYENGTRFWNYDGNGHWTLVGDLEVGESAEFTVYFKVLANGTLVNNVTATSNLTNETNNTNNTTAYAPNMTVQKITVDEIVYIGNTTSFIVVVTNTGDCSLSDVVVTDVDYSEGLIFADKYENSSREWTYDGNGHWTLVGDLEVGQSAEFTVYFNVNATGVLVNNVTATSNLTNETNGTNNTTAYGPDMTVQKITIDEIVYVGNTTSFRIVVTNTGDCSLSDVVVTDVDYSEGLVYADKYENGSREWTYDNGKWTLVGELAVEESADFIVYFNVTLNGTLVNNVTATSNLTNETNSSNNTTAYLPNMTVQKVAVDEIVYVGNTTSFIIIVTNTGDCNLSEVVVTDVDYSKGLEYANKYDNSSREWTYDGNGHWTLVGDLEPGMSAEFTVYFNVLANGTLVNNVTATSNLTNETNSSNNTTAYAPNLTVQKITVDEIVYVGNTTSFIVVVTNTGDCSLSDVVVTDVDYSEGLVYADKYENGSREWTYDNGKWNLVGDLEVGQSAEFTVYFNVTATGVLVNNVTATSNLTNETNGTNNTTAYGPNMTVQKITIDEVVYVGNTTSFRIVVTNTGDCSLSDVVVTDVDYSEGLVYIKYDNGSREWTYDNGKWTLVGELGVEESADFIVYFNVTLNGTLVNNVTATSNLTNETNNTNNTTAYAPNMTVQKITIDDVVYVGNITSFKIVVTNTGDCNLSEVVVTDVDYSEGLEFADKYDNSSRLWTYDGNGHWTLVGDLEVGESAEFTVYFKVLTNGTLINNVSATSNLTNETNNTNNTTAYAPNMTVQKITIDEIVYVGNTTSFRIVVTNTGDCNLSDVVVTDVDYSEGLVYANKYDNGSREWTYENGKWTLVGELGIGESADFTVYFNVTLNGTLVNNVTATSNLTNETNNTNNTTSYAPNMTVVKVTLDKEVYVGNTTRFTIVVENTGDCVLDNVYVVDTDYDHSALQYLRYENGSRNWNYDDNGKWTLIGTLAVGEKANFTVWFEVLTNGTFVNNVTAGSNLTNETNNTNNTTGKPICDLAITKIVNTTHCYVDDLVEWNITVVNHGPSTALDVIVKDVLPEGLKLVDVRGGTYNNDTHEWIIGTLDKDQSVSIVLVTQVLIDGTIRNNASVNTTINETNYTNNNATNVTEAEYICDLVITKAVNCTSCYVSDVVEWNITVVNVGPHNATNVIVKDILPEGMELISYRVSVGNFNEVISEWSIGTLEKDTPVSLVLVTKVLIDGTFINIATVNTTTPESDYTNNEANNTTRADPICDLVIIKVVDSKKVYLGEIVSWTIKITNNGPSEALDVKVEDILPDGLVLLSYKASKGKYVDGVWTVGTLVNGASETITLKTNTSAVGNITNPASVNTTTHESNYTNNNDNDTTEVLPYVDLVLIKSSDKPKYNVNDTMHWIIKVVNRGPCDAIDAYVLDVLPSSTEFVSYTSSKGSFDAAAGVWSIGDLANGEEAVLDIICKALSAGNFTNNATVNNSVYDVNTSNNYDNATIEVVQEDEPVPEPPEPTPDEPVPPVQILKTGNPLVVLLIALMAICGSALRCRKE